MKVVFFSSVIMLHCFFLSFDELFTLKLNIFTKSLTKIILKIQFLTKSQINTLQVRNFEVIIIIFYCNCLDLDLKIIVLTKNEELNFLDSKNSPACHVLMSKVRLQSIFKSKDLKFI